MALWYQTLRASKSRPRDPNLLALSVVEVLIGETLEGKPSPEPEREKNPAAVGLVESLERPMAAKSN